MTAFTMHSEDFSLDMLMRDGTTTSFLISAKPRITFTEEHVLVETATGESVSFNLADIQEYTYSSVDNGSVGITQIDMRHDGQICSFTSGILHFNYIQQGAAVNIYSIDGVHLASFTASESRSFDIPLDGYCAKAIIVSINGNNIKLMR